MLQVLTVCTGNVCRSPFAEALLAERIGERGVRVSSAGMRALVGQPATPETRQVAEEAGVAPERIDAHRARLVTEPLLAEPDLILGLAREHRHGIVDLAPQRLRQTFTLRELARLARMAQDDELAEAVADAVDPRERLRAALAFVSSLRGLVDPPPAASDDDVIDPYLQPCRTYELAASQVVPAVDDVARLLRFAAEP